MSDDLKIGDVVYLKSGGPKMTVNALGEESVHTVWFDGPARREGHFNRDAVTKTDPDVGLHHPMRG